MFRLSFKTFEDIATSDDFPFYVGIEIVIDSTITKIGEIFSYRVQ